MGERKVIQKYYPPDFDPSKIPKVKRPKNGQIKVRMMMPMSVRCNTCGEYLYKGKKFNSRKETVVGEEYLGIKIFRFYIRCSRCSAEFTIKTDPKNSDYCCEFGASRNFEPWRENQGIIKDAKDKREKEEMGDAMKSLENRTLDNKIEMDILDALDEIRSINSRNSKIDPLDILAARQKETDQLEQKVYEEDEQLITSLFPNHVKRIDEEEGADDDEEAFVFSNLVEDNDPAFPLAKKQKVEVKVPPKVVSAVKVIPKVSVIKKENLIPIKKEKVEASSPVAKPDNQQPSGLMTLLGYSSGSDDGN